MFTKKHKIGKQTSSDLTHIDRNMAFGFSAVILTLMLIVTIVGSNVFIRLSHINEGKLQETITSLLAQSINRISFSGKYHARLLVEQITASHKRIIYVTIMKRDGEVIAHSDSESSTDNKPQHNKRIIQQVLEKEDTVFEDTRWNNMPIRQIAMPYRSGYQDKLSGVIIVGISMNEFRQAETKTVYMLVGFVLVLALAFLSITLLLCKYFAAPVIIHAWQFKRILDYAPLLLSISDREGNVKESSAEFSLLSADDSKIFDSELEEVIKNKLEIEREVSGLVRGKQHTYLATSFPVLEDKNGEPSLICSIAMDITKHKQDKFELQKLSRAVEYSSSSVYITDLDGKIEYINPKFTEITGYSKDEAIGMNPKVLQSGHTQHEVYADLWRTITTGGEWKGELYNKKKDGSFYWARNSISGVRDITGEITNYIAIQEDVTHEYELSEQLNYQASHDDLTGLVNRREFEHRAERLLSSQRQKKEEHALCFMDLDQFKVINDTCGHFAGDEMLRQLSTILKEIVRKRDTLARLGGDEFGVLMEHCSLDDAHRVAASLQKAIQDYQFSWEEQSFKIGVSMGLVLITDTMTDLTDLLKTADAACYMAKDKGRNRIHIHHAEDTEMSKRYGEMQWVSRLDHALEEDRFRLFAQAIIPLDGSTETHYELLIRMLGEQGEIISPGAFLPAAERYNLISKLDSWVVNKAFSLLANNQEFLNQINFCSINLSGQSITNSDTLDFILYQLEQSAMPGKKICFEITETAAISNLSIAKHFISTLKEYGCRFALDDFGSGLSSFGYLKNLPVDFLKIDGMFVKDIVDDPIDHAMVKSINDIGQVMGMRTIAEFVENDAIKDMLKEIGVDYVQGYGVGKPVQFDELISRTK